MYRPDNFETGGGGTFRRLIEERSNVQCWDLPRARVVGPIKAWRAPWLDGKSGLIAGPDRVCEYDDPKLTLRCWAAPKRGALSGEELPANWQWQNPNHTEWGDIYTRSDRLGSLALGGSFSCLKATKHGVWCLGDNQFGQLGGSLPIPPPDAEDDNPAFVQHIWPAEQLAAGTWHACALAAPDGLADGAHVACWGRGDHGQLGAPAPDRCIIDGVPVACAKSAQMGVFLQEAIANVLVGDLFTCVSSPEGMKCWGANRDAFFGVPGSCPAALRKAWPTLHGNVAAPRAACSKKPVRVPNLHEFFQGVSMRPRGFCFEEGERLRCWGGVHPPRMKGVSGVVLNPGQYANACGLHEGTVVCWGEGYSAQASPNLPVAIAFAAPTPEP
ncbi:MAG TPA: hypothetical protein VFK05_19565 [Polyangiaceae bacterium]|nr:hypothetical protein [Polyangiaceae bacterium]